MDAVEIIDQTDASTPACLLHGAVLLASLEQGRVYPLNGPDGSAITVFAPSRSLPPFDFLIGPGVARVATADDAAAFPYGVDPIPTDGRPRVANPSCSEAGNARSSCWVETVTKARGNA